MPHILRYRSHIFCGIDPAGAGGGVGDSPSGLARVAELVCRGGLPGLIALDALDARDRMRDYLTDIARIDLATNRPASHDPSKMLALMTSLARNEATAASARTLLADTANAGGPADRDTVGRYVDRLMAAFVIEPLPVWSTHLRSSATLRKLRENVDTGRAGEPRRLMVITATGRAFETADSIAIVPITHLRP